MVQHPSQHARALRQPVIVGGVHHKDEAMHLMIIFWPDPAETLAASQIINGHVISLGLEIKIIDFGLWVACLLFRGWNNNETDCLVNVTVVKRMKLDGSRWCQAKAQWELT